MDQVVTTFVTLFVIIDPIGLTPMFMALTKGETRAQRRRVTLRAVAVGGLLLVLFGALGEKVLNFVGISMPAFRIAGGLLLFLTALDMLFDRRAERRGEQTAPHAEDPSVFPLAMPLIAGPGAIATMILLMDRARSTEEVVMIHAVLLVVLASVALMFALSGIIERALGDTGVNVATRLLGMLLAALSVQFVLDGLLAFGIGSFATTGR